MGRKPKLIPCLLGLIVTGFSSCLSLFSSDSNEKDTNYSYTAPAQPWQQSDPGGADVLFVNKEVKASIALNSVCRQYQSLTLEALMLDLKKRLGETEELSNKSLNIDGLPGLQQSLKTMVDNQPLFITLTVVRSRDCVYDFTLASSQEGGEASSMQYHRVLESFSKRK